MAVGAPSSAIYLHAPASGSQSRQLSGVTVHPVALFSILDHFLRRTSSQDRVIGTLLGTRTENEIEVRDSFAVPHSETSEQVAVDGEYHRTMFDLHQKVNPRETIVGWYSTGSDLNTYSALVQSFYSQETHPHQAILLSVDTGLQEGGKIGIKAYVSSPVGISPRPENCVFLPIPCDVRFHEAERSGLDLLSAALTSPTHTSSPVPDLQVLDESLQNVIEMIDRVISYVKSVQSGKIDGNESVGRYLMDAMCETTDGLEKGRLETLFNTHLQDSLMVSYLADLIRSQVEVSSRLTLVT